jgi:anti-sigma regulatory factor (Ser/Thr protein kinase)
VPSHPKYLPLLRSVVTEGAHLAGFDEETTSRLLLAVTEAVTNVIRHAYKGATDKRIDLEVRTGHDGLHLDLVDFATWIDPKHIASRPLEDVRPGGLGVHLIKTTMDRVEYRKNPHGGTTLSMVKHAPAQKEPQ